MTLHNPCFTDHGIERWQEVPGDGGPSRKGVRLLWARRHEWGAAKSSRHCWVHRCHRRGSTEHVHLPYFSASLSLSLSLSLSIFYLLLDRCSSVRIATRYGLDSSGIEFRQGRDFPHASRPTLWPAQLPMSRTGDSPGIKRPGGVVLTIHTRLEL